MPLQQVDVPNLMYQNDETPITFP